MCAKKKILIVEDEPDLATMLKLRLKSEGYEVTTARDGLSGYKKAKKLKPDIILADIMMPNLDGYSMAKKLREDDVTIGIPIIIVSVKDTMMDLFRGLGINQYFTKPFEVDALLKTVKSMLEEDQ